MNLRLDKLLAAGDRPGYGTLWRFQDLPRLQLAQGLYGGREWTVVRGGDGFFFLHDRSRLDDRSQRVLELAGNRPYRTKAQALDAVARALATTRGIS